MGTKFTETEHRIVSALIESKAVDFEVLGAAISQHGASATLTLDGEDVFCGTMRRFVRVFRLADNLSNVENLAALKEIISATQGR